MATCGVELKWTGFKRVSDAAAETQSHEESKASLAGRVVLPPDVLNALQNTCNLVKTPAEKAYKLQALLFSCCNLETVVSRPCYLRVSYCGTDLTPEPDHLQSCFSYPAGPNEQWNPESQVGDAWTALLEQLAANAQRFEVPCNNSAASVGEATLHISKYADRVRDQVFVDDSETMTCFKEGTDVIVASNHAFSCNDPFWYLKYLDKDLLSSSQVAESAVSNNPEVLRVVGPVHQDDICIVKRAVLRSGAAIRYASDRLRSHAPLCLLALSQAPEAWDCIDQGLHHNKDIVEAYVGHSGFNLEHVDAKFQDDYEVVLKAVKKDGCALKLASAALRNNRDVAVAAVESNASAYQYAGPSAKNNRQVLIAYLKQCGMFLEHAPKMCLDDDDVVRAAVLQDTNALQFASTRLRNNRGLVFAAAQQESADLCGGALKHASEVLKDDEALVTTAVSVNGRSLEYASTRLRASARVVASALSSSPLALEFASRELQQDRPTVLSAVRQVNGGAALQFAASCRKSDLDVVLAAVSSWPDTIVHVDPWLQTSALVLDAAERARSRMAAAVVKQQ